MLSVSLSLSLSLLLLPGIEISAQSTWTSPASGQIVYNPTAGVDRVGINYGNPQYPLDFGTTLQSRMIALYNNGSAFYGLGMSGGTMRFEVPDAAHTFLFLHSGTSEALRVQAHGLRAGMGVSKAGIGSAYSGALNWGTSYLGFNAVRDPSGNWALDTDNPASGSNGASALWGTVNGSLYFSTIANSGSAARTLTDAQMYAGVRMVIQNDGKVAIGAANTASSDYLLFVKKGIATGKVFVSSIWADYVFAPDYALMPLPEVAAYIAAEGRLPGIPSAAEVEAAGGVELSDMTLRQMEKIEELYLHVIGLNRRIGELEARLSQAPQTDESHE